MSPRKARDAERARNLVVVLGDQLDPDGAAFDGIDRKHDVVLSCEAWEEATYIPQHRQRLVLFFSAMRHFRSVLRRRRFPLRYLELDDPENPGTLREAVAKQIERLRPERVVVTQPGDHRVLEALREGSGSTPLEVRTDRHFLATPADFADFAAGRRELRQEDYYRRLRRHHDILMEGNEPVGGRWNYDADNRKSFGRQGPGLLPQPARFAPDRTTREVMELVRRRFPDAPGDLDGFAHPVTTADARHALEDFIENRLPRFGDVQDAMASGHPFLYHSLLSAPLNLHLLNPRDAIEAALEAWRTGRAPLNAVEGFVRQVLGWREYVRGIYWTRMPEYVSLNVLRADLPMPAFFWTAESEMRCIQESVSQLVRHAYAHHIQRLMVLGQLALLLGVDPYQVHAWHLSMYIDAIDWVSAPNVIGMSQYGDGGLVGSKPYCASGAYIDRMSDYCRGCRFDPKKATGDDACPVTTLYWDFLARHKKRFARNHRMGFQLKNVERKDTSELRAISRRADALRKSMTEDARRFPGPDARPG